MKRNKLPALLTGAVILLVAWFAASVPFFVFQQGDESTPAFLPFTIIVALSLLCIALDLFAVRGLGRGRGKGGAALPFAPRGSGRTALPPAFSWIRWAVMLFSLAALIWGGRILGTTFSQIQLPVLACPFNESQLTGAGCFLFGHLDLLLESGWQSVLWFVGSFVVCVVLFGRLLCGFVCPLGLLQDVMHQLRVSLHATGIPLTERLYAALRFVKWVLLLLFLGLGLVGGSFCDICPAITVSPALAGFRTSIYFSGFVMVLVLVSGFFKRRCFCNICPMGYLLGLPHRASLVRLKKDAVACTECGACYEACPMGIKSIFTLREGKNQVALDVTTAECIFCGECVRRCPEDRALKITLAGLPVYTASRERFMKDYAPRRRRK